MYCQPVYNIMSPVGARSHSIVCPCVVSLCTTLCLQWEPEVIAVAVMYLTSRLTKFDISDWQGKPSGYRGKWYEFIVEDVTLDLLEGTSSVMYLRDFN